MFFHQYNQVRKKEIVSRTDETFFIGCQRSDPANYKSAGSAETEEQTNGCNLYGGCSGIKLCKACLLSGTGGDKRPDTRSNQQM